MVGVPDVVAALGGGVLRVVVAAPGASITDIVIAEPGDLATDLRGDLVVGAAVADATGAVDLLERAGSAGAAGVVLRGGPARARGVRAAARRLGVALLELDDSASLVHLVGVVQDILDRSAAPDGCRCDPGRGWDDDGEHRPPQCLCDGPGAHGGLQAVTRQAISRDTADDDADRGGRLSAAGVRDRD